MTALPRIRVGAVNYLNTKPLIHEFERLAPQARLVLDLPSRLADQLAAGSLDVALIPSIECLQGGDYEIVSDACIACRGPVLSVKLFFRCPPAEVRGVALDEGSRTSVALVRVLLEERYGIRPEAVKLPIGHSLADTTADAVLLIGDRAIHSPLDEFVEVWDLGHEWCGESEHSFVFAMWAARRDVDLRGVEVALGLARDAGLVNLGEIARREAPTLGLTGPECLSYLKDNLYFFLGPRERQGLARYAELAAKLGIIPEGANLDFRFDCNVAG
jgi:chorismate dehydratase